MYERVAACPFEHAVWLLVKDKIVVFEAFWLLAVGMSEELTRHFMGQLSAFVFFLACNPVSAPLALVRVLHKWIRTATTLVEAIIGKAMVANTDGYMALLLAPSMVIAIFSATKIKT